MRKVLIVSIVILGLIGMNAAMAADGAAVFASKCAGCHGKSGAGDTGLGKSLKLKDLGSAEVQGLTDAQLTTITSDGKGKMPAFKTKLSADEIKAVVAFMRTLKK